MKIAFPTDEHFPFQDDQAREVAMMIVQDFDPDLAGGRFGWAGFLRHLHLR